MADFDLEDNKRIVGNDAQTIQHTGKLWEQRHSPHASDWYFHCPGCGNLHSYRTGSGKVVWNFDGKFESPTFNPSLRVMGEGGSTRCHLFLTAGKIVYCGDCPHPLAGKTVDMVEI